MSFPKKGKLFPAASVTEQTGRRVESQIFAANVASALNEALGQTTAHVKIVASWTGANERTVKNWFAGNYGPSGDHLVNLMKHCDPVFGAVLAMAGRPELLLALELNDIKGRVNELTTLLRRRKASGL